MTHIEFEQMVAAYGTHPDLWPEELAPSGRQFLSDSPERAKQIMSSEAALDGLLGEISAPTPSDLLRQRILKAAQPVAANDRAPARKVGLLHWRSAAAMMVGTFALGFGGANMMLTNENGTAPVYAQAQADLHWQSTADDLGLSDVYTWVEGDTNDGL